MSKYTPFSLFIRQALLYPLASPFLPPVAKVEKDFSYANGTLIGTLEAGGPALVWQTDQNVVFDWFNSFIYAEYLELDGVTISEMPQNIWRLPNLMEICLALVNSFFPTSPGFPGGFLSEVLYHQSDPASELECYTTYSTNIVMCCNISDKIEEFNVRCVKI